MDGPPADDCCSICHGLFNLPFQANCSHWFCGSCIMLVWEYGSWMSPCKCPLCRRQITLLVPGEASGSNPHDPAVSETLGKVERYNRLSCGSSNGVIQVAEENQGGEAVEGVDVDGGDEDEIEVGDEDEIVDGDEDEIDDGDEDEIDDGDDEEQAREQLVDDPGVGLSSSAGPSTYAYPEELTFLRWMRQLDQQMDDCGRWMDDQDRMLQRIWDAMQPPDTPLADPQEAAEENQGREVLEGAVVDGGGEDDDGDGEEQARGQLADDPRAGLSSSAGPSTYAYPDNPTLRKWMQRLDQRMDDYKQRMDAQRQMLRQIKDAMMPPNGD